MFELFFGLSSEAFFLFDEKGFILRCNPAATKAFGYTESELIGQSIDILIPTHLRDVHIQHYKDFAKQGGKAQRGMKDFREVQARHRDGHTFPVNAAIGKEMVDGKLTFMAIINNLTREKEADERIRFLATFSEENTNPTLRIQTDGKILFSNTAGKELLALTSHPKDNSAPTEWMREINGTYKTGSQKESVFQYQDKIFSLVFAPITRMGYVNIYGLDITGRENSRMRLELSDDILRSVNNLVLVSNSQGRITYVSPSVKHLLGYEPEELMGDGWWGIERITGGDIETEKAYVKRAASGETIVDESQYEHQVRRKDGAWRTLMFSDAKGPRDLLIGIGADITDLKLSEQALKESEARYRLAISNADAVPYELNYTLNEYTFMGEEIERITGYTREELTPDKFDHLLQEATMRGHFTGMDQREARERIRGGDVGGVWRCDFRIVTQAGESRWISDTSVPVLGPDGKVSGAIGFFQDITARKLTEMQLQNERDLSIQIMNNMGQGLVLITFPGATFDFVNPAIERMFGYETGELLGKSIKSVVLPEDFPKLNMTFEHIKRGEISTLESRFIRKDGSEFFGLVTVVPRAIKGAFSGAIATITDLTERYRIEKELRQAYSEAMSASQFKSTFLATMSHEIRTPMNAIIGMNEILLDSPLTEEQREFAKIIGTSAQHLLTLINDILDLSKIEAGKMTIKLTKLKLSRIVSEVVLMLKSKAYEKGLNLEFSVDPSLPEEMIGDPERIRQVLVNLVGNAIKFTETGVININISAAPGGTIPEHDDDEMVNIAVSDTGIGIPEEAAVHLFEPFQQVDGGVTRKYGGSGLGLAISRRLVELMHGKIGFDSVEGMGSTFWFVLPLARFSQQRSPDQKTSSGQNSILNQILPTFHSEKPVLVVDDNEINTKLLVFQLTKFAMKTTAVSTSEEAIKLLTTRPEDFCLTLMDVQMPIMDGLEITGQIRRKEAQEGGEKHSVIVAVTANALSGDREICLEAGMDDYLSKPVSLEALSSILKKWVKG